MSIFDAFKKRKYNTYVSEKTKISCDLPLFINTSEIRYEKSHEYGVTEPDIVAPLPEGGEFCILRYPGRTSQKEYHIALMSWLQMLKPTITTEIFTIPGIAGVTEDAHGIFRKEELSEEGAASWPGFSAGDKMGCFTTYMPYAGIKVDFTTSASFIDEHLNEIRHCASSIKDITSPDIPSFSFKLIHDEKQGTINFVPK